MPFICIRCGLDGLQWNTVRTLLKNVFLEESIHLKVYSIDGTEQEDSISPRKLQARSPVKSSTLSPSRRDRGSPRKQPTIADMFARATPGGGARKRVREELKNDPAASSSASPSAPPTKQARRQSGTELPDIFSPLRVVLSDRLGEEARSTFTRYVLAYGGEVLEKFRASDATHVVYAAGKEEEEERLGGVPREAEHVWDDFLEDSIKLGRVQSVQQYRL